MVGCRQRKAQGSWEVTERIGHWSGVWTSVCLVSWTGADIQGVGEGSLFKDEVMEGPLYNVDTSTYTENGRDR